MNEPKSKQTGLRPTAAVYDTIREMAIEYRFRPDEKINEVVLAKRLGVSRTPVREALNRLLNEGLIHFQKNHGFFCRSLSASDLFFLAETRRDMEVTMLKQVVDRASAEELIKLRDFCQNNLDNLQILPACELARADAAYHGTLASLTRNPVLQDLLNNVNARVRFMRKICIEDAEFRDRTFDQHLAMTDALIQRNLRGAQSLMHDHLHFTEQDASRVIHEGLGRIFKDKIDLDVNLTT